MTEPTRQRAAELRAQARVGDFAPWVRERIKQLRFEADCLEQLLTEFAGRAALEDKGGSDGKS